MKPRHYRILLNLYLIAFAIGIEEKICPGNTWVLHDNQSACQNRVNRWEGCTVIDGDLILIQCQGREFDFSGLQDIELITGHLYAGRLEVEIFEMKHLRVILGKSSLFNETLPNKIESQLENKSACEGGCGLVVQDSTVMGISFPSLTEVSRGSIVFQNNSNLCPFHDENIDWHQIIKYPKKFKRLNVNNGSHWNGKTAQQIQKFCHTCHVDCDEKCWHSPVGPSNAIQKRCQIRNLHCEKYDCPNRCEYPDSLQDLFTSRRMRCCHSECLGGCWGPGPDQCFRCRSKRFMSIHDGENQYKVGECIAECPKRLIQVEGRLQESENGYFEFLNECIKECPEETYYLDSFCLRECPHGHTYDHDDLNRGVCKKCSETGCPKTCFGVHHSKWLPAVQDLTGPKNETESGNIWHQTVNSVNIHIFKDCEVVVGSLVFQVHTFGDESPIPRLTRDDLEPLRKIKRIMGYLSIDYWPFESFEVFERLEVIHGQHGLWRNVAALFLANNDANSETETSRMKEFGLKSLKSIENGNVIIMANEFKDSCHVTTIDWTKFIKHPKTRQNFDHGLMVKRRNDISPIFDFIRNNPKCKQFACHEECDEGCWGEGNLSCIQCKNYEYKGPLRECLRSCDQPDTNGTKLSASSIQDGRLLYKKEETSECQPCHDLCKDGCYGSTKKDCYDCKYAKVEQVIRNAGEELERRIIVCQDDYQCPQTYYLDDSSFCQQCSPRCNPKFGCTGPGEFIGPGGCNACSSIIIPRDYDPDSEDQSSLHCRLSSQDCPDSYVKWTMTDTMNSKQFFISNSTRNSSLPGLPTWIDDPMKFIWIKQYLVQGLKDVCFECPANCNLCDINGCNEYKYIKVLQWIFVIFLAVVGGNVLGFMLYRRYLMIKKKRDEDEPLICMPNTNKLNLIQESELEILSELGTGAFGTVHRGNWNAPKDSDDPSAGTIKFKVAIKTLTESKASILEEALTMACCDHENLVRFVAVCQTQPPKLITEFLPRGDALRYVRRRRDQLSSKQLLSWCHQISDGMAYLSEYKEGTKLVHRDLAARNILVKNPNHVKIADFGLAQMIDHSQDEGFIETGGKMPLKWLAIECIEKGHYSHKSDVWSFGVTIWEILTYGKRPFQNVLAKDLLNLLKNGGRLEQPDNCSTELYTLLLTCWFLDPETRPKFSKISDELQNMEYSSKRYIVITPTKPKTPKTANSINKFPHRSVFDDVDEEHSGEAMDLEQYLLKDEEDYDDQTSRNDGPIYANGPFIEQNQATASHSTNQPHNGRPRETKKSDSSIISNDFYVPEHELKRMKLDPAPPIANWRRNREEPRYMNSAGTNVSTSSWSSANTPTWTPEHQAGSSNSVSFEMRDDQRKRTMSNPRYMSFSERESDEM